MKNNFDAIVIGTGQSGPFLAVGMAASGQRVAMIERGRFGRKRDCIFAATTSGFAAHMIEHAPICDLCQPSAGMVGPT